MSSPSRESASGAERPSWVLPLAGLAAVHVLLVLHFVPRTWLETGNPVVTSGFGIEVLRVARARLAYESTGALFTYDPLTLSGQLAGLVEPLGTRVYVLGALALGKVLSPVEAMYSITWALHAAFPFLGALAARGFGLRARACLLVFGLYSSLWFFDSVLHGAWFTGRLPWAAASAVTVLSMALLHLTLAGGSAASGALAFATGLFGTLIHPVAGLLGVGLGALLTVVTPGVLPRRRFLALVSALSPLGVLVLSRVPVAWALSSEPENPMYGTSLSRVLWDLLEVPASLPHGPGATRSLIRSVVIVLGTIGLVRYASRGDSRRFAILPLAVLCLAVAYGGGMWRGPWPVDPYLFVIPAVLALALPAAEVLSETPWSQLLLRGSPVTRIALTLALVLGIPRAARTLGTYVPELLPTPIARIRSELARSSLIGLFEPMPDALRHEPMPASASDLAGYLSASVKEGRVLVFDTALAAFLGVRTPLDVIGPVAERGSASRDADPGALLLPEARLPSAEAFLRRYAVSWVILPMAPSVFDQDTDALEPVATVFGHRVRRVKSPTTLIAEGSGTVTRLGFGKVRVESITGQRLTLRLHYSSALTCRPDCRIEEHHEGSVGAGFLSIVNPPGDVEISVR